ncbi:MAG: hypothetical protein IKP77_04095 [Acholeplasmatales bacterium]|nr:hypothetical protein [Acholeplasmatales bacterium]
MKVLFKAMHRDIKPMDIDKDQLVSIICNIDYSKPFKLFKHIYLYEKVYNSFGEDSFNGYVKCRNERISLFEECYIVKKTLFGFKDLTKEDIKKIEEVISEDKPMKW